MYAKTAEKSVGKRARKLFQALDKGDVDKRSLFGKELVNPLQNRMCDVVRVTDRENFHLPLNRAYGQTYLRRLSVAPMPVIGWQGGTAITPAR